MSTPDDILHDWFQSVWVQGDESAIDRLMHPDAVVHGLGAGAMRGPEEFKPYYHQLRAALGNFRITLGETIVQDDRAAAVVNVSATHVGHGLGMAPTNRELQFHGITIVRTSGGKLVEGWNAFDFLTMYQQIGAPPPGF